MKYFGSSGIRGIINQTITPQLTLKIGQAIGTKNNNAIIGWDPRISQPLVYNALLAGLLSTGCTTTTTGMVTTPTLAHASKNYDCGIMITASHNTAEYNGIKLWNPDGTAYNTRQQQEIEDLINNKNFKKAGWKNTGNQTPRIDATRDHLEHILKHTKPSSLTVIVDCGCGAASNITPYLLREMGCKVITLNSQPDGYFPARNPEPTQKNLEQLKKTVKALDADLGIAHDGDADRMMAVDNKGNYVTGDKLLALFGKNEAKKSMVAPVDTSMAVEDAIKPAKLIYSRVGDVHVAETLKQHDSDFGGETSGSWIFPQITYCPDGIYAAAHLVELVTEQGPLNQLLSNIPTYQTLRTALTCTNPQQVMGKVEEELTTNKELNIQNINTLDGVKITTPEGWALIRPSGTEPKIRITTETRNNPPQELYEQVEKIVKKHIK